MRLRSRARATADRDCEVSVSGEPRHAPVGVHSQTSGGAEACGAGHSCAAAALTCTTYRNFYDTIIRQIPSYE